MIIKIQSLLYYIYRATSSAANYFFSRVTSLGILIFLLIPATLIVFITYYKLATLYLFSLLCGILVCSVASVLFRSAKLKIVRELPPMASAGQEITYTIKCRNLSPRKLVSALIHDLPVDPRPTRNEFINSREPQEHLRNGFDRLFSYYRWLWLIKKKTKFQSEPKLLTTIDKFQEITLSMQCTPMQRGRLKFSNAKLYLPDPLYLLQKCVQVESSIDSILVLPRRYKLPSLMLEGAARDHLGGLSHSYMSGVSDDFRGLRPYRPGDSLKHIDWAAWARTGNPTVREFENVFFPRYGLVLDTNGAYEHLDNFEEAISVAASFARVVDTQECLLDFIFLNKGPQTLTVGKGVARSEDLLEHLATLEIEIQPDWASLSKQVLKHSSSFSVCVVIFTQLSDERKQLVTDWKKAGLNLLIIVLVNDELSNQAVSDIGATPIWINNVQRDLLNML
jgi:uncharacterized protein (DUF58 family)